MQILVAAVGPDIADLFIAIRSFDIGRIMLITYPGEENRLESFLNEIKKFGIRVDVAKSGGDIWEDTFRIVHSIKRANEGENIIINVSSGGKIARCAMTSAAFVNGLKAFAVNEGEIAMLPVLKFSYYKLITDRKMRILETLHAEPECCDSLEELSRKSGMSLPLVSYHINGNPKSEGLREMGLVETKEEKGRIKVVLSLMGKILMDGYVEKAER